jgi:hypothetical protein
MALEQLRAWRDGQDLEALGPTQILAPDRYPLLRSSELAAEHHVLSDLIEAIGASHEVGPVLKGPILERILASDTQTRTRYYLAIIERTFAYDARLGRTGFDRYVHFFDYGPAAVAMAALFEEGNEAEIVVGPTLEWFNCYRFNYYGTPALKRAVAWITSKYTGETIPNELRERLIAVRGQCSEVDSYGNAETLLSLSGHPLLALEPDPNWPPPGSVVVMANLLQPGTPSVRAGIAQKRSSPPLRIEDRIDALLGRGPWLMLVPCEEWTRAALSQLAALPAVEQGAWGELLWHCHDAKAARPSGRWLKEAAALLDAVGNESFREKVLDWFSRMNLGRIHPTLCMGWENVDEQQRMHEVNAIVLRGLLWLCPKAANRDLIRSAGDLATSAYRKIRGLGPRAVKVGNAAVYALSQINDPLAVGQLALLKVKVKFGSAQKEIEKAFNAAAARSGLPREELEEMSVPSYGLTQVGLCEEKMGEFKARLTVTGTTSTELVWVTGQGKVQRALPASVKQSHKEDLKELQAAAKDIQKMLPAQRERIDGLFLQQKSWPLPVWRERYLNHPLVGTLARRILWDFKRGDKSVTAIWFKDRLVDLDLKAVELPDAETRVQLWHPIGKSIDEAVAWRSWLDAQQIQQPFKQAHREVYILTDAERSTRTYSNRYAAHVLKQHQFNALCALRGWKSQLRLMVDAEYGPPTLLLPQWGLRAEFWVEGLGTDYGTDTNESGVYLHVSTDQVRFYRTDVAQRMAHAGGGGYHPGYHERDAEPVPVSEIPELVFSEVMRDVDMFVGVASVGNDPAWSDGGPQGRYQRYWQDYSFGDLTASAKTRKEVLQKLVPRLKISSRCAFEEKFLVVRGALRTYKIHLGSGNILMSPNDQYLCIVPNQAAGAGGSAEVFLPFEGDRTLSVILSKAFLLAEDGKISDETIVRQIRPG